MILYSHIMLFDNWCSEFCDPAEAGGEAIELKDNAPIDPGVINILCWFMQGYKHNCTIYTKWEREICVQFILTTIYKLNG